ncbi:MAG: UbiX family flavin prenyltransferase [Oligoflexales bacterium]
MSKRRVIVGITGASGVWMGERLIQELESRVDRIYLVCTTSGHAVIRHELKPHDEGFSLYKAVENQGVKDSVVRFFRNDDFFSPIASGTSAATDMIVLPCSMGTLARISAGLSTCLLERAADVMMKERRRMILSPREAPYSALHLRNMLSLAEMGVDILPPNPGFYTKPQTTLDIVNFIVGKTLDMMGFEHDLYKPWNQRMR